MDSCKRRRKTRGVKQCDDHLAESLRIVAILLQPIMTETPAKIFEQLGLDVEAMNLQELHFGEFPSGTKVVGKGTPIFPRLDIETEVEFIQKKCLKVFKPRKPL